MVKDKGLAGILGLGNVVLQEPKSEESWRMEDGRFLSLTA